MLKVEIKVIIDNEVVYEGNSAGYVSALYELLNSQIDTASAIDITNNIWEMFLSEDYVDLIRVSSDIAYHLETILEDSGEEELAREVKRLIETDAVYEFLQVIY